MGVVLGGDGGGGLAMLNWLRKLFENPIFMLSNGVSLVQPIVCIMMKIVRLLTTRLEDGYPAYSSTGLDCNVREQTGNHF